MPQAAPVASFNLPWSRLLGLRWAGACLVLALGVAFLLPMVLDRPPQQGAAASVSRDEGRLESAALYENAGHQFSHIQLLQRRSGEQDVYRIKVSDMQTGKSLSESQEYRFAGATEGTMFRYLSDGHLYLTLKERQLLRFDPGAQQFVDMTEQVAQRFAPQLSTGISKIKFVHRGTENLEVTSSEGVEYLVSWVAGQILPRTGISSAYQQAVQGYTQLRTGWRLAPVYSSSISNRRYQLVQTWSKWEPGQIFIGSDLELFPENGDQTREDPRRFRSAGGGYAVKPYVIADGFVRLEPIEPATLRFNAQVLAQNSSRVLLIYSSTPDDSKPRVLQLLNKETCRIVWSRTIDQVDALVNTGLDWYAQAIAVPSGFYLSRNGRQAGFFMDNEGSVVHDFAADKP